MWSGIKNAKNGYYTLKVPGIRDKRFSVSVGGVLRITPFYAEDINKVYLARVIKIVDTTLYLKINRCSDLHKARVNVEFILSRFIYIEMHTAVDKALNNSVSIIFPEKASLCVQPSVISGYYNPNIKMNIEQRMAVNLIVHGSSNITPFILHGPPGTGKTVTIVEAILQLVRKDYSNRILVCAHSNTAVDNVACVLLKYKELYDLPENLFVRVNSKARENIPDCLAEVSKFSPVDLQKYQIVLCTLNHTVGYGLNLITHLIIDEAGQTTEPSCLLPVYKRNSPLPIVLSGDDMQLGPVVLSSEAKNRGLELSLMERLKKTCSLYKNNNSNNQMIMLRNNYRSHADIIDIPNNMFYNGNLRALAAKDPLSLVNILNKKLKCRAVVFHGVLSTEKKIGNPPSYSNKDELVIVKKYVCALLDDHSVKEKDIAIIATYFSQVTLIRDWIIKYNLDIQVDTVDAFQGQEKRVVIISTVRGKGEQKANQKLGFVTDAKRFNVALTRAKAKAVVIGNPLSLQTNKLWKTYIDKCRKLGTHYGCDVENLSTLLKKMHL